MTRFDRTRAILLPLVAFASGSLLGGALLHLLPEAVAAGGPGVRTFLPALAGFALFFLVEQFLAWHRSHARCSGETAGHLTSKPSPPIENARQRGCSVPHCAWQRHADDLLLADRVGQA